MCTRYTLTNMQALAEFCATLGAALDPAHFPARFNVALTQGVPVIISRGGPHLVELAFGLTLPPRPPETRGLLLANARAETIRAKRSFREAVAHRRCLIPADGFYEFEKAGKARLPHFFHLPERRPFCFAGLWEPESATAPAGCVIVTTAPNALVGAVHDRMPVLFADRTGLAWLGEQPLAAEEIDRLCQPFPAGAMTGHRVDPRVNHVRYAAPDAIAPLGA